MLVLMPVSHLLVPIFHDLMLIYHLLMLNLGPLMPIIRRACRILFSSNQSLNRRLHKTKYCSRKKGLFPK